MPIMIWPVLLAIVTAYPIARYTLVMRYPDHSLVATHGFRLAVHVIIGSTIVLMACALYVATISIIAGVAMGFTFAILQAIAHIVTAGVTADHRNKNRQHHPAPITQEQPPA